MDNASKCKNTFTVTHVNYNERREISELAIADRYGRERFNMRKPAATWTMPPEPQKPVEKPIEPEEPKKKVIKVNGSTKLLTKSGYLSIAAIDKEMLKKMYDSGFYKEANAEIEKRYKELG